MTLVNVVGDVGSGKTLFTTHQAIKDDRPIYSNYALKLDNYHDLKPEDLNTLKTDALVIIDEAYTWLESRLSGRDVNMYLSYILFQHRKRKLDMLLTDQLFDTIDIRYRQLTNYIVECDRIGSKDNPIAFEYRIKKVNTRRKVHSRRFRLSGEKAKQIYPVYDTDQLISSIDDSLMLKVSVDKKDILSRVDQAVKELLKKSDARNYTKGTIANYCLRNNLPKNYTDLIYNTIRATLI